jgi:hypothetical protein
MNLCIILWGHDLTKLEITCTMVIEADVTYILITVLLDLICFFDTALAFVKYNVYSMYVKWFEMFSTVWAPNHGFKKKRGQNCPCAQLIEYYAMKMYGGVAVQIHCSTRWRWVVYFTLWPLYPWGRSPWYPMDRRVGGPKNHSGWCREEKILDPTRTQATSFVQPVASC